MKGVACHKICRGGQKVDVRWRLFLRQVQQPCGQNYVRQGREEPGISLGLAEAQKFNPFLMQEFLHVGAVGRAENHDRIDSPFHELLGRRRVGQVQK